MADFNLGFSYAYAPHNIHPLSPFTSGYEFYKDPTDPFKAGQFTGSITSNVPIKSDGQYGSFSTLVWMLASRGGSIPIIGTMALTAAVDLQVRAGSHIASGGTKGKDMYTGSRRYEETAKSQGHNLVWTGGGGGITI